MHEGKQPIERQSFQLCPPMTQPEDTLNFAGGGPEACFKVEFRTVPPPQDWALKQAEARVLWTRFLVRRAQGDDASEGLKETA